MDAEEVKQYIDNSSPGVFDSRIIRDIQEHVVSNEVDIISESDDYDLENQRRVILEFHDAIEQKNISKIASTMFNDEKYEMLLSPLSSRHLTSADIICGDITCTALYHDITVAENYIESWKSAISTGDLIDIYRQQYGQWYLTRVTDIHRQDDGRMKSIKIHYMFWSSKFDEIISGGELDILRMSPAKTMSSSDHHRRKIIVEKGNTKNLITITPHKSKHKKSSSPNQKKRRRASQGIQKKIADALAI